MVKAKTSLIAVIAANIRQTRLSAKMSQTALAQASGVSRSTIAQIENGRYSSLSLVTLEGISAALDVPETALLTSDDVAQSKALSAFCTSPWFEALRPTKKHLAALERAVRAIWQDKAPPPAILAELLQTIQRHG